MIITDADNNQITAFHPGAMQSAHDTASARRAATSASRSSRPTAATPCCSMPSSSRPRGMPFVFDPGQGLPMFDGDELRRFVAQATWVAVNDYEGTDAVRTHRRDA